MAVTRWFVVAQIALVALSAGITEGAAAASPRVLQSRVVPPSLSRPGQSGQTQQEYPEMRIAAVVNDDVISVADLDSRIRMVMLSTAIPDTAEARGRLSSQVLRSLVDEKLEMQEAKRKNVTATETEVNRAIASIAQQNNMKPDQLFAVLKGNGIERTALETQVSASIVWAKLIRQKAAETDPVSDQEIDTAFKRFKQNENAPEARVAEIFLPVDSPQQD